MHRRLIYVLAWTVATVVAVGGSWVGLQSVLSAATPDRPQVLSASQLRQAADASPGPTLEPAPTARESPPAPPAPPSPSPDSQLQDDDQEEWSPVPDTQAFERAFSVRGGEVVIWASRSEVRVVSATPTDGYDDVVTRWSATSVRISFQSADHTSRVWVTWRNGPYAEVTESA